MENVWMTIAEIAAEPRDMASGNTIGFVRITMWASTREEFVQKLEGILPNIGGSSFPWSKQQSSTNRRPTATK
jgi:hypothetical protein